MFQSSNHIDPLFPFYSEYVEPAFVDMQAVIVAGEPRAGMTTTLTRILIKQGETVVWNARPSSHPILVSQSYLVNRSSQPP